MNQPAAGPRFSFAQRASERVDAALVRAEVLGQRGEPGAGLSLLAEVVDGDAPLTDDDVVALAEIVSLMRLWGAGPAAYDVLDRCLELAEGPAARGAVQLAHARCHSAEDGSAHLTAGLSEFAAAGDVRGQAVTLARMAYAAVGTAAGQDRLRLGRSGVALARRLGDPWTVAYCTSQLAIAETYLGEPRALERWAESVDVPTGDDALVAEIVALGHANWAFTAIGFGDLEQAARVVGRGRLTARGEGWAARFASIEAFLLWRRGDLDGALAAVEAARHPGPDRPTDFWPMVAAGVAYERDRHLDVSRLAEALPEIGRFSRQVAATAAGVLALSRHARGEPRATREVEAVLDRVRDEELRFGWEDALVALALVRPERAAERLADLSDLWPENPRATALRDLVEGLTGAEDALALLLAAAEALQALPEPVTAGWAWRAAAHLAPDVATGNGYRRRAVELFQRCGADRSLAAVVRDRRLPRDAGHVAVPPSQARAVTAGLTVREREVALLAGQGLTAAEIAEELHIGVGTVRNHLMRVRAKFGGLPKRRLGQALGLGPSDLD